MSHVRKICELVGPAGWTQAHFGSFFASLLPLLNGEKKRPFSPYDIYNNYQLIHNLINSNLFNVNILCDSHQIFLGNNIYKNFI